MLAGLKTFLLKAVDLSALTFLEPVVRLAWGEEPPVQMRRIGRNIVIPVIAVCLLATYTQASKIWLTHQQEEEKKAAYDLTGPDRAARLAQVDARLDELVALDATARQGVTEAEAAAAAALAEAQAPLDTEMDALKAQIKTAKATRKTDLKAAATDLDAGNKDAYATFLAARRAAASDACGRRKTAPHGHEGPAGQPQPRRKTRRPRNEARNRHRRVLRRSRREGVQRRQ